jgi:hypothetical protein
VAALSQPANSVDVPSTWTTFYTLPASGFTSVQMVYLKWINKTGTDRTVQVRWQNAGGTVNNLLTPAITVPANDEAEWRGLITQDEALSKLQHIASAASALDQSGTILENS